LKARKSPRSETATDANWIFLLVRTDKQAKKQEGISFLLVDMASPGITVRPIINLEMHDEFSEVFFDNVRVPKANLVGQLNKGWDMAKALLGFETLTFAPIDRNLVEVSLLTQEERQWLNGYHAKVLEVVAPQLDGEALEWAREACAPL